MAEEKNFGKERVMESGLSGVYIPAVTPFNEKEELDCQKLKKNIEKWNSTNISGYMCLGSNGEFKMLDEEESCTVIRTFAENRAADKGLIAGVGRESLYHTLRFIERLERENLALDYISVLTPHYFKTMMNDKALVEYYIRIADNSPYPLLLYCAPGFANGVCLSADAVKKLASHPNIAGIKDTSSDMMEQYMDAVGTRSDFSVMAGSISNLHNCLKRGGEGGVLSAANYFPDECARLFEVWKKQGEVTYLEYERKLQTRIQKTGGKRGVSSIKYCMNLLGYEGGRPRSPLTLLDPEEKQEIKKTLQIDER